MSVLAADAVRNRVKSLPGWSFEGGELVRQYQFEDFVAAMRFVNRVAELAETSAHHPDIDVRYNKVRLALISHDAGGITERDMKMAAAIGGLD